MNKLPPSDAKFTNYPNPSSRTPLMAHGVTPLPPGIYRGKAGDFFYDPRSPILLALNLSRLCLYVEGPDRRMPIGLIFYVLRGQSVRSLGGPTILRPQRLKHLARRHRKTLHPDSNGVVDGVGDCSRWRYDRYLTDTTNIPLLQFDQRNGRFWRTDFLIPLVSITSLA